MLGHRIFVERRLHQLSNDTESTKVSFVYIFFAGSSLQIFHFRCHQLPDCSFNVRLVMDFYPSKLLNLTVEIFGEVRLFDPTSDKLELESSHSLINKLRNLQTRLENERGLPERPPSGTNDKGLHYAVKLKLMKEIEAHKERFKPVIQVYTIRHVREAKELIAENLHFRQIQNYRKSRLRLK